MIKRKKTRYDFLLKYDVDIITSYIKESNSYCDFLNKVSYSRKRRTIYYIREFADLHKIDISHLEREYKKNVKKRVDNSKKSKRTLESLLIIGSSIDGGALKKRLIESKSLEDKCSECGLLPIWQNEPITLQLDHINRHS